MFGQLTEIKRQNPGLIIRACCSIAAGKPFVTCKRYEPDAAQDLMHIDAAADEQWPMLETVLAAMRGGKTFDPVWDVQVLVARNDERHRFNKLLQALLNPVDPDSPATGNHYRTKDKVICLRNCMLPLHGLTHHANDPQFVGNYDIARDHATGQPIQAFIANGDMGRVEAVEPRVIIAKFMSPARVVKIPMGKPRDAGDEAKAREAREASGAGDDRDQGGGSASDFDLAYAITCHKSQGSEWPCAIVMIDEGGGMVCSKQWMYTAVSRAAKLCIMIGRKPAALKQCRRDGLQRRRTFLVELLKEGKRP